MPLSGYQRTAYRLFASPAKRAAARNDNLRMALQRAHLKLRPEMYVASAYLTALVAGLGVLLPTLFLIGAQVVGFAALPARGLWFVLPLPFVAAGAVYLLALLMPDLRARGRARTIEAHLPYALNYIATMSAAGATPKTIFAGLARQPIYREMAAEAAWIHRDMDLLGHDIVTALQAAIDRSPSAKLQDLWQGAITALTSGGDLQNYFLQKSEQFMLDNRQDQKRFLQSLGVLAESFVVVVVAAPLFLIVMLTVMTLYGSDAETTLMIGYVMILVMLPLAQAGFGWTIKTMTPEV